MRSRSATTSHTSPAPSMTPRVSMMSLTSTGAILRYAVVRGEIDGDPVTAPSESRTMLAC